jgi:phage-related protein
VAGQIFRDTFVYKRYFWDFYYAQNKKVQGKIDFVIGLKHIEGTDGLYEIRIKLGRNNFRVFCFFDEGSLIILLGGFQKKSDKTAPREISNAEKQKKEYYYEKSKK